MAIEKRVNNILFILAVGFIAVFIVVIISVNNWLKQSLKEETIVNERPKPVIAPKATKYKQAPIAVTAEQEIPTVAAQKKSAVAEKPIGAAKKESKESLEEPAIRAGEVLLN